MTSLPLVGIWNKRSVILHFALMNIKARYRGTFLGLAWTALEPTLTFILLYIVFTSIRIRMREDFAIYLLTGVILYHIFTRGTLAGLTSLSGNSKILQSIKIKKEFFPVVATAAITLQMLVEVAVFFGLMLFFQFIPTWTVILLIPILILLIVLILGLSYILSILHVYFKDIHPFWGILVHALFFVTPIMWYLEDVEGILLTIFQINPLGQLIEIAHQIVLYGQIPPLYDWAYSTVFVIAIFVTGFAIFKKYEKNIVEVL